VLDDDMPPCFPFNPRKIFVLIDAWFLLFLFLANDCFWLGLRRLLLVLEFGLMCKQMAI